MKVLVVCRNRAFVHEYLAVVRRRSVRLALCGHSTDLRHRIRGGVPYRVDISALASRATIRVVCGEGWDAKLHHHRHLDHHQLRPVRRLFDVPAALFRVPQSASQTTTRGRLSTGLRATLSERLPSKQLGVLCMFMVYTLFRTGPVFVSPCQ